jgi:alcohol dehydrogenase class IV
VGPFALALPTRILFGPGTRAEAGAAAAAFGRRAVLVTGGSSFDRMPHGNDILASLEAAGVAIVGRVRQAGEPDDAAVATLAAQLSATDADVLVAVGGGSVLDLAKASAVACRTAASVEELLVGQRIEEPIGLPIVALPTTAGSGAEVSHGAIVLDRATRRKRGIRGPGVAARVAIVDPEVLLGAGSTVTAESGLDAVAHAIETSVSRAASELVATLAADALPRLLAALPRAIDDPMDLAARTQTAYASMLMGVNLANSTTCLPHRLQYPVGALTGTSHPRGVAALLPAWLERTRDLAPSRLAALAWGSGLASVEMLAPPAAALLVERVLDLMDAIGLRVRLADLGVGEADIPTLVAATEGSLANDPGPTTRDDLAALYRASL